MRESFSDDLKEIRDAVNKIDNRQSKDEEELIMTKIELDKCEQLAKSDTIRIHNVPVPSGTHRENVNTLVQDIMTDANIPFQAESMIQNAYRPTVNGLKKKTIVCKLKNGFERIRLLKQRKTQMRDNNQFQQKWREVFITEDLTPLRQLMSFKLRHDKARIEKAWSMDGKIKCIKKGQDENSKPITIDSPYDLSQVGWTQDEISSLIKDTLIKRKGE